MYKFPSRIARDSGYIAIIASALWLFTEAAILGPKAFNNELVFCAIVIATAETAAYNVWHLCGLIDNMFPGFKTKNKIQEMLDIATTLYMMYAALDTAASDPILTEKNVLMAILALFSFKHIVDYTIDSFQYVKEEK